MTAHLYLLSALFFKTLGAERFKCASEVWRNGIIYGRMTEGSLRKHLVMDITSSGPATPGCAEAEGGRCFFEAMAGYLPGIAINIEGKRFGPQPRRSRKTNRR